MKIAKFNNVKGYKSFTDFSWSKFCKKRDKQGNCIEPQMSKFSVFFGENGSGKSSLCEILKNLSGQKDFQTTKPEFAEVLLDDNSKLQSYSYTTGKWNSLLPNTSIIFFDIDFINSNVHTNGVRSSNLQSGAHTQKSGKLIIDLDQKANDLNIAVNKAKDEIELFDKTNTNILAQQFSDPELNLYDEYIKIQKLDAVSIITELESQKDKLDKELLKLEKLRTKSKDIQSIQTPIKFDNPCNLSELKVYQEVFNRVLEKKVNAEVDQKIKDHFEKHKSFIELAKDQIPPDYSKSNCPLCMQPLKNATNVIEFYRSIYDKTFEISKSKYLEDISKLSSELLTIKSFVDSLEKKSSQIFDTYEAIKNDFGLTEVYKIDEKSSIGGVIGNFNADPIKRLLILLENLKQIDRKHSDPTNDYNKISSLMEEISKVLVKLNTVIKTKNELIDNLKTKYSDASKIQVDIDESNKKLADVRGRIDFLTREKLSLITKFKELNLQRQKLIEAKKSSEDERDKYITQTVPENIIKKMITVLDKFNLNFTVEPYKSSASTKDYAFAFKIKDTQGNERELKDGLSEGERQLISLSFFFAINDNISDKQKKILIFDDPITSLDAPNLKILAEIIHSQKHDYSQVIVLTHHPLFHKYLVKPDIPDKSKFGVLKNSELFGGSFIFSDSNYDMIEEVKLCNQEIASKATSGNLKLEEISLKYGQLLRLAVEKFVKHELLMWNTESDFGSQIVRNLKSSKSKISKLTETDFDTLTNIYNYCNQSNLLHVDKENPSALSELINNINRFTSILDKCKK